MPARMSVLATRTQSTQLQEAFQRLAARQSYSSATQSLAFQADGQLIKLVWWPCAVVPGPGLGVRAVLLMPQGRLQRHCRPRAPGHLSAPLNSRGKGSGVPQTMQKREQAAVFI